MKIKISSFYILPIIIPWFFPASLTIIFPGITTVVNAWKCISWFLILFKCISNRRWNSFTITLHIFWLVFFLCTLVSHYTPADVNTWLVSFCSICGIALLFDAFDTERIVRFIYKYFLLLALINFIMLILNPDGFESYVSAYDGLNKYASRCNFLCTDNMYGPFMMSLLLLNELYITQKSKEKVWKLCYYGCWMVCTASALLIFSATSLVGLSALLIYKFCMKVNLSFIQIKPLYIAFFFILMFVGVYYFNIQKLFSFVIINILGKDLTLTGRIELWTSSIEMIKQKFWLGWGCTNKGSIILRNYYYWYAHNLVLDILLEGGIVTLSAFAFMIANMARRVKGTLRDRRIKTCMLILFVFALMNIAESHLHNVYFYFPIVIAVKISNDVKSLL